MTSIWLLGALILVGSCQLSCCDQDSLTVVGSASVKVDADIAAFTVSASQQAPTSLEALKTLNSRLAQANQILEGFGLPPANRSTSSIYLSPQYKYENGTSILVGQQASASLSVRVGGLTKSSSLVAKMLLALSKVKGLSIGGLNFQNSNPAQAYTLARIAAVRSAKEKAQELAGMSQKKLQGVAWVRDQNRQGTSVLGMNWAFLSLQVPPGKVQVSSSVEIAWHI